MKKKISIFIGIFLMIFLSAQTQRRKEELQKQNEELQKQIAEINNNLAKTKAQAKLSLSYLNEVNKKIELREKVYQNTQKQKRILEDDIYLKQLEINRQRKELEVLRKNYAEVLVKAYKNKGVQNKVTFILSSKNLGEAIRRMQYLKNYSDYQQKKAAEIFGAAEILKKTVGARKKSVQDKENLLTSQKNELLTIEVERKTKEDLLVEFKNNEAKLTAEIKQKQQESKKLEATIRSIIAEEIKIAKAKEEAEKKEREEKLRLARIAAQKEKERIEAENKKRIEEAALAKAKAEAEAKRLAEIEKKKMEEAAKAEAKAKAEANERAEREKLLAEKEAREAEERRRIAEEKALLAKKNAEELARKNEEAKKIAEDKVMTNFGVGKALGSNFVENKGKLLFPVQKGDITHFFGKRPHPVFKNIIEDNIGIKISVPKGSVAKCVFPGEVSKVFMEGGTKNVMVRHGSYFTIYSNLSSTNVATGQKVSAGTIVGTVAEDYDGTYTLDFQIWNGTTPVDPLNWVSR